MKNTKTLFLKLFSFSITAISSFIIISCSSQETSKQNPSLDKQLDPNDEQKPITKEGENQNLNLISISSNASNDSEKSVFWIQTNKPLDTTKNYFINLDNKEIPIQIKKSAFENKYFGYTEALEQKTYKFKHLKFDNSLLELANSQSLDIKIFAPVVFNDPKLDFVEPKNPVLDTLTIDTSQNRVENFSNEEQKQSAEYKQLFKLKKLKNWSAPYFAEYIRDHNLNKLSYENEAKNEKFIAPFNNEAKKSNVMYQLTVYSFADGNNDGIGDFIGLKDKLDYFSNLGIDTLYISPVHPASTYHGYDVIDYTDVAPELGGMKAFDDFITEAHKRGIKVVMDMVLNHTSYEHPWFQKALAGDEKYQKYYYMYEPDGVKRKSEGQDNVRQYFKSVYNALDPKQNPTPSRLRWVAQFWSGMPDLNLNNEEVLKELDNVHKFWAKKGVDGFRYDAFEHYFKSDNPKKPTLSDSETTKLFSRWRKVTEDTYKEAKEAGITRASDRALLFGEWWRDPAEQEIKQYWGQENQGLSSVIDGTKWKLQTDVSINWNEENNVIKSLTAQDIKHEWMPFLDNHDVERWINNFKTQWKIPVTVTPHKLSDLERSAYEYAMFSLLSRGGLPTLYNGNEILMQGAKKSPDTNVREAFFWKDLRRRVFFQDSRDVDQIISSKASPGEGFVEDIVNNPNSSYNKFATLIKARQDYIALRDMDTKYVADPKDVLYIWKDNPLREDEMTLRKNPDGTYLLIIYSFGDRPKANLSIRSDKYEISKTIYSENLKIVNENTNDVQIHGSGSVRLGIYLIKPKS
ncbi:alpha-amylase family glycosyl hydrolase [Mycoplasma sp. 1654_15]|uniref:alpha-amylase family glycosyl hydrolase n=1 Tax=Mycoplasma sp. 1654_15 TaxID=2725994 RepID=UPI00144A11AE|nr:alpha-amylase family glycosyl hydrolase [Mycoplasma sp. 1654_15]QJB71060.1 alpha-amylase [Mycoplasma sp. 1654_15]